VRYAAKRVPVAIVSGAARAEIGPVVEAAGLAPLLTGIVASDDVGKGKPDPEGYLRALELFDGVRPEDVVVLEDTEAGIAAAKAAGMRVIGKAGTVALHRLVQADEVVEAIDAELMKRILA
jgi:beta-phosphoglucomutase